MTGPERPDVSLLRVVRGNPTDEELAALVAVLAGRVVRRTAGGSPRRSAWNDRAGALRRPLAPGRGAWRRSTVGVTR